MSMDVHYSSQRGDWRTPAVIWEAVRRALPEPVFDAAPDPDHVPPEGFYRPQEPWDALSRDGTRARHWPAPWFCNPPYGRGLPKWILHIEDMQRGMMDACKLGILLVPARTDTRWWHDAAQVADAVCFVRGRLRFEGAESSAPFPSCLFVFGTGYDMEPLHDLGLVL